MKLEVFMNENDYLEFNIFHMLRSPYGEKLIKKMRILMAAIFLIGALAILILLNFKTPSIIGASVLVIMMIVFQLFYKKSIVLNLKMTIKQLKKKGKMAYAPYSTIEFKKDSIVETTDTEITEKKYSAVERICVVENKYVYIYTNNVGAYIIPMGSFSGTERFDEFLNLLKGINKEIKYYK